VTRVRHRRSYYAKGRNAIAECQRSGQKMRYRDLVEDGHIPGLLVHPAWYEPRHPQELPVDTSDAVALWEPAPEISVPPDQAACPISPEDLRFFQTTTLDADLVSGGTRALTVDAVTYDDDTCIFIELDGGGWLISRASGWYENEYFVDSKTPLIGVASAGNQVYIGIEGSGAPRLTAVIVIA